MNGLQTFLHPYLGIYTKCFLWQTEGYNVWIDAGLRPCWEELRPLLSNGNRNVLLLTHGHWDHTGGAALIRRCGGAVYAHPADRRHLTDLNWHWELLFGQFAKDFDLPPSRKEVFWTSVETPVDLDYEVSGGEGLVFGRLRFRVIPLPGHSGGSVGYLEETTGTLFTGDSIMGSGFFSGVPQIEDFSDYQQSMERLKGISPEQVLTDHSGPVEGKALARLAQDSIDCAGRMLEAVSLYAKNTAGGPLTVGGAAGTIAAAEGKSVGGNACVSALGALRTLTDDPRAQQCTQAYLTGIPGRGSIRFGKDKD